MSEDVFIHGFGISNFRSFPLEPAKFGPCQKINIIIGANNSGKSNVLRYVRTRYPAVVERKSGKPLTINEIDRPRRSDGEAVSDLILLRTDTDQFKAQFGELTSAMQEILQHSGWADQTTDHAYWMPLKREGSTFQVDVNGFNDPNQLRASINRIWSRVNNTSGGSLMDHWLPELMQIAARCVTSMPGNVINIPATRQIKSHLEEYREDYTHDGLNPDPIILELAKISQPSYSEQHKRVQFDKIITFLRHVLHEPELNLDIPFERNTITVHLHGRALPIEALGTGIHELVILASKAVLAENKVICIEEPELHFHPELQRQFMEFIYHQTNNQYFITTHSAHVMDSVPCSINRVYLEGGLSKVSKPLTGADRRAICHELGYKPSDLLQSNCVIWVEGPSDRIYLNHWIEGIDSSLVEGLHYSIMFYGGALRSHLSAEEETVDDFIKLLPINRFPAMLIDSDKDSSEKALNPSKQRIQAELDASGLCWVTDGREIENYVDRSVLEQAVKDTHKDVVSLASKDPKFGKPLNYIKKDMESEIQKGFDKVAIARHVCKTPAYYNILDLGPRIKVLVEFIHSANKIARKELSFNIGHNEQL